MAEPIRRVAFRDSTLREGLDTPGVAFDAEARRSIAARLQQAGVAEAEVVAPSRVLADLRLARQLKDEGLRLPLSGLVYSAAEQAPQQIEEACATLDRVDLLLPVSERRPPRERAAKIHVLRDALACARHGKAEVGVGFPNATQVDVDVLLEIARDAVEHGAARVTVYDTNGSSDPFAIAALVRRVVAEIKVPIFFHAHDDLGLATANAFAAVGAGAQGLDVTVAGLGDRAGNASLEQLAVLLHLRGFATGIQLSELGALSRLVADLSGVPLSGLAPVVGEYVFDHKSPGHLREPDLFEAFDPALVGRERRLLPPAENPAAGTSVSQPLAPARAKP